MITSRNLSLALLSRVVLIASGSIIFLFGSSTASVHAAASNSVARVWDERALAANQGGYVYVNPPISALQQ